MTQSTMTLKSFAMNPNQFLR